MATATHLPGSFFNSTPAWNSSQPILSWVSKGTEQSPETPTISNPLKYVAIVILSIVFVVGSVGNLLVIWILGFKMKRTVVTLFFLHLSVADFVFVVQIPLVLVPVSMEARWVMGNAMCKLLWFTLAVNKNASVYFLTVISADRYVALLHPVASLRLRRLGTARWLCRAAWTLALLLSVPPLVFSTVQSDDDGLLFCYSGYSDDAREHTRHMLAVIGVSFVASFAVPYGVMIYCYCRIGAKLARRVGAARRGHSLRIVAAVVVAFFVCWAPYHAIGLMEAVSYIEEDAGLLRAAEWAEPVIWGFAFVNSCVNPVLYVFSGSDLKARFRRSLVAAIENAFRDHEQMESAQDSRSGASAPAVAVTNFGTNVSSSTSAKLGSSRDDVTLVELEREETV